MKVFSKKNLCLIFSVHVVQLCALQSIGETPYTLSRIALKHRDHKGIGFNEGYSTLALFLAPNGQPIAMPFLDGRFHVFNNTYFASNMGMGIRFSNQAQSYLFGMNAYYDYRGSTDLISHQVGGGLEILSRTVDFRINGYKPLLGKYEDEDILFSRFKGHRIFLKQKVTYALPMAEAEVGFTLPDPFDQIGLYVALGGYYLFKQKGFSRTAGNVPGAKVRLVASPTPYISFGAECSYDQLFGCRANGFIALNVPLGIVKKNKEQGSVKSKVSWQYVKTQDVNRQEIVPFYKKLHEFVHVSSNGDPFTVFFVDNTKLLPTLEGSGVGTFEDPYTKLSSASKESAAGDMIYVSYGDGTSRGYDEGYQFKDYQKLVSSGLDIDVRGINIPAKTPGQLPIITAQDKACIELIGVLGAELRGFYLKAEKTDGVYAEGSSGEISFNKIEAWQDFSALRLVGNRGILNIENNELKGSRIDSATAVVSIKGSSEDLKAEYKFIHNTIIAEAGVDGIYFENVFDGVFFKENTLIATDPEGRAIYSVFDAQELRVGLHRYENNEVLTGFHAGIVVDIKDKAFVECDFQDNQLISETLLSGIIYRNDSESAELLIKGHHIKSAQEGILIENKALESIVNIEGNDLYCYSASPSIAVELQGDGRAFINKNTIDYGNNIKGEFSAIACKIEGAHFNDYEVFIESNEITTRSPNQGILISNTSIGNSALSPKCLITIQDNEITTLSSSKGVNVINDSPEILVLDMENNFGSLGFNLNNKGKGLFKVSQEEVVFREINGLHNFYDFQGKIDFLIPPSPEDDFE